MEALHDVKMGSFFPCPSWTPQELNGTSCMPDTKLWTLLVVVKQGAYFDLKWCTYVLLQGSTSKRHFHLCVREGNLSMELTLMKQMAQVQFYRMIQTFESLLKWIRAHRASIRGVFNKRNVCNTDDAPVWHIFLALLCGKTWHLKHSGVAFVWPSKAFRKCTFCSATI